MKKKQISRRRFLRKAACASTAAVGYPYVVASSALGKAGSVAASNRITMGCIGVGGQGTGNMRGFLGKAETQVVAVCDDAMKSIKVKKHEFVGKYATLERSQIVGNRQYKYRTWKSVVYMVGARRPLPDYVIAIENFLN